MREGVICRFVCVCVGDAGATPNYKHRDGGMKQVNGCEMDGRGRACPSPTNDTLRQSTPTPQRTVAPASASVASRTGAKSAPAGTARGEAPLWSSVFAISGSSAVLYVIGAHMVALPAVPFWRWMAQSRRSCCSG